jgi:hypothetical protein
MLCRAKVAQALVRHNISALSRVGIPGRCWVLYEKWRDIIFIIRHFLIFFAKMAGYNFYNLPFLG